MKRHLLSVRHSASLLALTLFGATVALGACAAPTDSASDDGDTSVESDAPLVVSDPGGGSSCYWKNTWWVNGACACYDSSYYQTWTIRCCHDGVWHVQDPKYIAGSCG